MRPPHLSGVDPAGPSDPILALRDLTISFGGVRAVDGLSFDVPPGSILSLIGPNGAGKTTVLNSVSGFVRARGSIRYRNVELLKQPGHRRAGLGIGRTFQNLQLFSDMTLLDNVLTGQHAVMGGNVLLDALRFPVLSQERLARERAMQILESLDIHSYAYYRAGALPLGVQKLAGVARALATQPSLLLLDEPAAGLNSHESEALGRLIHRLCRERGLTALLVEHNMKLVMSISDRVVVLDHGRKLTEGLPSEVSENPAVIEAYLGVLDDPAVAEEVRDQLAGYS